MNIFVYDGFLDKYKKTVRRVEENLNKLKLQGKIIYLRDVKNLKSSLESEINMGAKTIITVGNNETVNRIIGILSNISEKIPLAIIPVGPNNSIAQSLGISNEKDACYILSGRRVEKIKLAQTSSSFFINNAKIKSSGTSIYIDGSYKLFPQKSGECTIYNLPPEKPIFDHINVDPQDNLLNLCIDMGGKRKTHLLAKKIEIKNEKHKIVLDDSIEINCPEEMSISGNSIPLIVGKERKF